MACEHSAVAGRGHVFLCVCVLVRMYVCARARERAARVWLSSHRFEFVEPGLVLPRLVLRDDERVLAVLDEPARVLPRRAPHERHTAADLDRCERERRVAREHPHASQSCRSPISGFGVEGVSGGGSGCQGVEKDTREKSRQASQSRSRRSSNAWVRVVVYGGGRGCQGKEEEIAHRRASHERHAAADLDIGCGVDTGGEQDD